MRILVLDGGGVISGDALVGALADLGVKPSAFEWELSQLDVGDFHLHFDRPAGGGVAFSIHGGATHRHAEKDPAGHGGDHAGHLHHDDHQTGHHPSPADASKVRRAIVAGALSDGVKRMAIGLIAEPAEAPASLSLSPSPLTEEELQMAAEAVSIAVGLTALGVDGVSFTGVSRGPGPAPAGVPAALELLLPPPASLDGFRVIQRGVGHGGHGTGGVTATLLEG